jgi:hypothetical protein
MIDEQDFNNWRYNVDDTLCSLQEKILDLEKKVKLLEEKKMNAAKIEQL